MDRRCKVVYNSRSIGNFADKIYRRYHQRYYDHGHRLPNDRVAWSRNEARASLLINTFNNFIKTGKIVNVVRVKKFISSTFTVGGISTYITSNSKCVPLKDVPNQKTKDPKGSFVSACYFKVNKGSNCKFLGKFPKKVGPRPVTFKVMSEAYASFRHSLFCPEKYRHNNMSYQTMSGGWHGGIEQLRMFSEGNRLPKDYKLTRTLRMADHVIERIFRRDCFKTPSKFLMYITKIKPKANPGGDLDRAFLNKGEAYFSALRCASRVWDSIHSDFIPNNSIYTVGGRSKRIKNVLYKEVYSRAVMQHDMVEFLVAKPYTQFIENHFKDDFFNPCVFGLEKTGFGLERIAYRRKMYKYSFEADWSQWDARTIAEKIIVAFGICRSMFPEGKEIDKAFCYFCDGFLNKTVVCPDGNYFKFFKGVPSGNAWTSIINSIVNCLCAEEIFRTYRAFGLKDFDYQCQGDDLEAFSDTEFKFDSMSLVNWVRRRTGGEIDVKKVGCPIRDDADESTTFLKISSFFNKDDEVKHTASTSTLFERCSSIQSKANNVDQVFNFLHSQLETYVTCPKAQRFISNHCTWYAIFTGVCKLSEAFKYRNDLLEYISMINAKVFESLTPNKKLLKYTIDDTDRVFAFKKPHKYPKVNTCFSSNWLKDNLITARKDKISKEERKEWFVRQTGERTNLKKLMIELIPAVFEKLDKSKRKFEKFLEEVGISIKNLFELYNNYCSYGSGVGKPIRPRYSLSKLIFKRTIKQLKKLI